MEIRNLRCKNSVFRSGRKRILSDERLRGNLLYLVSQVDIIEEFESLREDR